MSPGSRPLDPEGRARLLAEAGALRPELHRYCARLMGSTIEGEDIVQDTFVRAADALQGLQEPPLLRPWLFRIAHNRALDLLRSRSLRAAEPIEAATDVVDETSVDALESLMRQEAVGTAISRFVELGATQRSVIILKDVLGEPLAEIAALLDLSIDAVKAHLARGRARLREINERSALAPAGGPASVAVAHYVAMFNGRDWDGLRSLLAEDVKLSQASHPLRSGRASVGSFFSIYAQSAPVWLAPAWLEGGEVIAVFEDRWAPRPSYMMWLEWRGDRISFIHDYRYARYVVAEADLTFHPGGAIDPSAQGRMR